MLLWHGKVRKHASIDEQVQDGKMVLPEKSNINIKNKKKIKIGGTAGIKETAEFLVKAWI